ncbi:MULTISPECIES: hypothetical protein [Paraliobacillus]|uniref:hypothetical protein n=1 Tax=Paraliobacillus TaxID=200903 RepID=UPI000DD352CE|nr:MULTISPECIES: hypothetical protein [Paraliobacillus]
MDESNSQYKEELLLQAVKTQYSILRLLDNTLYETYQSEKRLPEDQQNTDLINLAYQIRNIVGKKPKLKEVYKKLEDEYGIHLN